MRRCRWRATAPDAIMFFYVVFIFYVVLIFHVVFIFHFNFIFNVILIFSIVFLFFVVSIFVLSSLFTSSLFLILSSFLDHHYFWRTLLWLIKIYLRGRPTLHLTEWKSTLKHMRCQKEGTDTEGGTYSGWGDASIYLLND